MKGALSALSSENSEWIQALYDCKELEDAALLSPSEFLVNLIKILFPAAKPDAPTKAEGKSVDIENIKFVRSVLRQNGVQSPRKWRPIADFCAKFGDESCKGSEYPFDSLISALREYFFANHELIERMQKDLEQTNKHMRSLSQETRVTVAKCDQISHCIDQIGSIVSKEENSEIRESIITCLGENTPHPSVESPLPWIEQQETQ